MKKLILTDIQAGVRKLGNVKSIYEHMEAAYVDALADITKGLVASSASYIVLRGCINSGSGSDYNISAGAILKDGEIFTIPAFVGTAGGGQVPTLTLVETKTALQYTDNSSRDTLNNRTFAWVFGASGSGLVDFSGLATIKAAVNSMLDVAGQVAAIVDSAPGALDTLNELAAALGDDANFATTVTNALAGKVAKAGDVMTGSLEIQGGFRTLNSGPYLLTKVVEIGDWNMDTSNTKDVAHGLANHKKIRSVSVIVRDDTDANYDDLLHRINFIDPDLPAAGINQINATDIQLYRHNGRQFDSAGYDSTPFNRGWVIIVYEG
jgi:hypothetical protein